MATETFFKQIIIGPEAADRLIAELERPKEPYVPKFDRAEVERSTKEWLEKYRANKLSEQKKN